MSEMQQEVPEWVVRMRAAGYNVRIGTINEPLSEIPEAMFYPPPGRTHRFAELIANTFRRVFRLNASTRAGHAPVP
jgi:hypothetical protein